MPRHVLGFVGDVLLDRDDPDDVFDETREILGSVDVLFGNLEGAHTHDRRPVPGAVGSCGAPIECLPSYRRAGFDVLSLANNHILDVGYEAMLDTRAQLRGMGVQTCGVGETIADARRPAIVEAGDLRVAYLAYSSVFPIGYEARTRTAGLVPMRAYTFWRDPTPSIHVPGQRPLVTTVPDERDLQNLADDIDLAHRESDLVVTSFHWGDFTRPFHLTDHETRTARFAIDHGADVVVGHHHHALRGFDWYKGKPIMYGLGHFTFDLRMEWSDEHRRDVLDMVPFEDSSETPYAVGPREGWPTLPMHPDTRLTGVAFVELDDANVAAMSFLPCRITADGHVHPVKLDTPDGEEALGYLERCNEVLGSRLEADSGGSRVGGFEAVRVVPDAKATR